MVKKEFYWLGLRNELRDFIKNYKVCKKVRADHAKPSELLQPLPIPSQPWLHITIEFVEELPKSKGFDSISVIVIT